MTCNCTLCTSLYRLHRLVIEGTRYEADLFVSYATVRVRNVVGELEDFLEAHRPEARERAAPPPPLAGTQGSSDPTAGGGGPEREPAAAATGEGAKSPRDKAADSHPKRPVFTGERKPSTHRDSKEVAEEKASRTTASKSDHKDNPEVETQVKKEEEAPGYIDKGANEESPGVREVNSRSPSRAKRSKDKGEEESQTPKKRRHRHHRDRSRDRKRKKDHRSSSSPAIAGPSRPEPPVEEVRRPRSPSRPPPHWKGSVPPKKNYLSPGPQRQSPRTRGQSTRCNKKKETQKTFKEYVAWRRLEKKKGR